MTDFLQLGIRKEINYTLKSLGLVTPTPIQEKTIPTIISGKDVIAQAQTGTGKTLAFVLPILEKIDTNSSDIQALILTPTRELAQQITKEIKKMIENLDEVNVLAVYGGQDVAHQLKKLKGAQHIVVATPGRLLDHIRRETIDLSTVQMLVLDEADQMLHMGFLPEVDDIIYETLSTRQTMLFSATMPSEIKSLAKKYMIEPENIQVKKTRITVDEIKQVVVETTDRRKQATLFHLLQEHRPFLGIIFCRTKIRAKKLYDALIANGYEADELHGDLTQAKREKAMKRFREAKIQFLVATDVAARGIDVEGITHVFNYDIPQDVESYVHRIGRTGRAGGDGVAFTLVAPKDYDFLHMIEKGINQTLEKQVIKGISIPDREDYQKERQEQTKKAGRSIAMRNEGRKDSHKNSNKKPIVQRQNKKSTNSKNSRRRTR
ncbi:DEAD/DEAH box helicase [Metabacillus sediminilitoris]|uniref:DEAD/DEAH box helicase n=1 Tax=Metabacillus sediminilitoris TaxID=2567941 RepID=A0A4S4BXP9_9BACI|nr:DEAD/DEAH box helicase [Metabacillus sediminilitoris]QGQ46249.1 DEAD/DEAH box helicase [Metabacillus sediminilitoris]THF79301.1 DEAD/DEAH box helicase [Metabacillus sediminilitoris]